jgi:hypothetical protein
MASAPRFARPRAVDSRTPGVRRLMPTATMGCSQSQQPPASSYGHGPSREEPRFLFEPVVRELDRVRKKLEVHEIMK